MENNGVGQIELKRLQKPIAMKWRVQRAIPDKTNPTHVIMVAYVDARDVQGVLDEVVGPENWQSKYFECKGKQFCEISIFTGGQWVTKGDSGNESQTAKEKGETSDAFKRAAVHWGINRTAYRVGEVKLACKIYMGKPYPIDATGKFLKGQALYDECNKLGKVDDMELEFDEQFNKTMNSLDEQLEEIQMLYNMKEENLSEDDKINAERILKNRETFSYNKLRKLLQSK